MNMIKKFRSIKFGKIKDKYLGISAPDSVPTCF